MFLVNRGKRKGPVENGVFEGFKFAEKICGQFCPALPFVISHRFEYVDLYKRMNDKFHISNRSEIRRRSSSKEIPISGFAISSSYRRVASATPSSSSRINSGSERRSFEARVARSEVESPSANSSTVDMFAMTTIISQVVSSFSKKLNPFGILKKEHLQLGCCCDKQCSVPRPQTRSTPWMPMTFRFGKSSASLFRAMRSLGPLNVGTRTDELVIRKFA